MTGCGSIIDPAMRVKATCDAADACGGCALQFLGATHHATIKSAWIRDAFLPFMDADTVWHTIQGDAKSRQRRRARWWRGHDSKGVFLGFRARRSHTVVRTTDCQMVHSEMDALRLQLQEDIPRGVESIRATQLTDGLHLVFEASAESVETHTADRLLSCIHGFPCADSVMPWWRAHSVSVPLERPVKTLHDRIPAGDAFIQLSVGPDDFIQGNAAGNAEMVRQVQAWAGTPRFVADLFCGVGNLSLPLAYATGAEVRGADASASSIRQADASARRYGLNARYESMNLFETFDLSNFCGADVLILDPPRKGAKRICRNMGSLLPASIIMVNCGAASGARDATVLHQLGYRLRALRAFDLFPYTGHVEAMSLWRR